MAVAMPKFKLMQKLVDNVNLVSREILTGLSVIRAFGREKKEEERFDKANKELTKTMLFTNRVMTFMMPVMMLIMNILTVGIVWFGAKKIDGGNNHRYNLTDGVLLKDNHIGAAGGVKEAIKMAKDYAPFVRKIEVEVENLDMVKEAVEAGADIIMLDNMEHDVMKEAVDIIDGRAEIEISGNVTRENIAKLIDLGVDYISSGALTHSSPILDISLKNLHRI